MSKIDLLNSAEVVISKVDSSRASRWTLWVNNKKLFCTPVKETPKLGCKVMNLTAHQIKNGLTSSEWNGLDCKLRTLWKERLL